MNHKKIISFLSITLLLTGMIGSVSCSNKTKSETQQSDSVAADNQIPADSVINPTKSKKGDVTTFSFTNSSDTIKVVSDEKGGTCNINDNGKKTPLNGNEDTFTSIEDCRMCNGKVWIIATRSAAGMMDAAMRGTCILTYDTAKKSIKTDIYCSEAKFAGQNAEYQETYIKNPDAECEADFDFASLTRSVGLSGNGTASDNDVIRFIKDMYNGELYGNNDFLEKYCTKALLKHLKSANEYDDGGYATWLFRSDAQDGPSDKHRIINVTPLGNSWYKYTFYDMGVKGTNKVKVVINGSDIKLDKIEHIK